MKKTEYRSLGENIWRETLPCGLPVTVVTKPGFRSTAAYLGVNYGSADRDIRLNGKMVTTPEGIAHFMEHKMFDMPDGTNAMNTMAATGAQPNAFTGTDITAYYFETTTAFYENLETLLRYVTTPYFTDESVQKEQGIIGQEISMGDDSAGHILYRNLVEALYKNHPVKYRIDGTVESIAEITPELLHLCHSTYYTPGNMALCVVGNADPARVREIAVKVFGNVPSLGSAHYRDVKEPELPASKEIKEEMEVSAPHMLFGFKCAPAERGDEMLRQRVAADLALSYLYGTGSEFFVKLYEQGLINADFSAFFNQSAGAAYAVVGGETKDPYAVEKEIIAEAADIAENGFNSDELTRVRKRLYGGNIHTLTFFSEYCESLLDAAFNGYDEMKAYPLYMDIPEAEILDFIRNNLTEKHAAKSLVVPNSQKKGDEDDA